MFEPSLLLFGLLLLCVLHSDIDEKTELDALRLENDTLRRNLGRLEEKVKRAEENVLHHQQEQKQPLQERSAEGQAPNTLQGCSAPLEVCHLHGILQWLQVSTIIEGSKHQLILDVFSTHSLPGSQEMYLYLVYIYVGSRSRR